MSNPAIDAMEAKLAEAKAELDLTGALRNATPQQAVDYIEANVTTLATAKSCTQTHGADDNSFA